MASRKNVATIANGYDLDDMEQPGGERQARMLLFTSEFRYRKAHLMNRGVKEIRCAGCNQIRPIAGAEQVEQGWLCEACLSR